MTENDGSAKYSEQRKGRPPSVSLDEIMEAGSALEKQGKAVTGHALRKQLGNRGRPDYLLRQWRKRRGSKATSASTEQATGSPDGATWSHEKPPVSDEPSLPAGEPGAAAPDALQDSLNAMIVSRLTASLESALAERGQLEAEEARLRKRLYGSRTDQRSNGSAAASSGHAKDSSSDPRRMSETSQSEDSQESPQGEGADQRGRAPKAPDNGDLTGITFLLQRLETEWTAVGRLRTNCQSLRKRLNKASPSQGPQPSTDAPKQKESNKTRSPQTRSSRRQNTARRSDLAVPAQKADGQQKSASANQQNGVRQHEQRANGRVENRSEQAGTAVALSHKAVARNGYRNNSKQNVGVWRVIKQNLGVFARRYLPI